MEDLSALRPHSMRLPGMHPMIANRQITWIALITIGTIVAMSCEPSSEQGHHRFTMRQAMALIIMALCILGSGCQDVATTWSAEVASPDGQWLATARSQQWGGPGTAYDATTVNLRPTKETRPPTEVLGFSHQYATIYLKMEWITPKRLNVTYAASSRPGDQSRLPSRQMRRH
jgi:hypothetical protein